MFTNILSSSFTLNIGDEKLKRIFVYSWISQRDPQGPDNFILSKDFERENLICWRFSVYQLNTFSADSPFRFLKYYINQFHPNYSAKPGTYFASCNNMRIRDLQNYRFLIHTRKYISYFKNQLKSYNSHIIRYNSIDSTAWNHELPYFPHYQRL